MMRKIIKKANEMFFKKAVDVLMNERGDGIGSILMTGLLILFGVIVLGIAVVVFWTPISNGFDGVATSITNTFQQITDLE